MLQQLIDPFSLMHPPDQYAWLYWALSFLIPWLILFALFPRFRKLMWRVSLVTSLFGLTEPLFVPSYWNPPSLFDLAQRTGFDIESLIFCFGIGGVATVLYNVLTKKVYRPLDAHEQHGSRHRYHRWILFSPILIFIALSLFPWNAIYPGILSMFFGALGAIWCRPDLKRKTWVGGIIFLGYYFIFLVGLEWQSPGYIERVWNLEALSGVKLWKFPIEEFLFAFSFGMYWSSVYEHLSWQTLSNAPSLRLISKSDEGMV